MLIFFPRATVDLSLLERDKTHSVEVELEDGAGCVHLLITISAITSYRLNGATGEELTDTSNVVKKYVSIELFPLPRVFHSI